MTGEGVTGETRIAVVVLTYNRPVELVTTLQRLHDLPERPRIQVVDNGSVHHAEDEVRERFPRVEYLRLPRNIGAAARNAGVERLSTPYVAFCDDDTWWERGSLREAANILAACPRLALVTARVLVGESRRLDPTCAEMARSPLPGAGLPGPALLGFLAGASVVRRDAFLAAGGFEPRFFLGGEEELLALDLAAAGWDLAYVDRLTVRHHPSSVRDSAARRRYLLRNALRVAWLRRPLGLAIRKTGVLAIEALHDGAARKALLSAVSGLPWALRRRKRLPAAVEAGVRMLEGAKLGAVPLRATQLERG